MTRKSQAKAKLKPMTTKELDELFDKGGDITPYLDLDKAVFVNVHRVNVDFPSWMVKMLDKEAEKLNISRQAVIKMWISERLDPQRRITR